MNPIMKLLEIGVETLRKIENENQSFQKRQVSDNLSFREEKHLRANRRFLLSAIAQCGVSSSDDIIREGQRLLDTYHSADGHFMFFVQKNEAPRFD